MKFDRFHDIPSSLVDIADDDADLSEEYRQLWSETARHIMEKSEADCLAHSRRTCACGSPATTTSQIPTAIFHEPERRVVVLVDPLCDHERCRTQARQETLLDTDPHAFVTLIQNFRGV